MCVTRRRGRTGGGEIGGKGGRWPTDPPIMSGRWNVQQFFGRNYGNDGKGHCARDIPNQLSSWKEGGEEDGLIDKMQTPLRARLLHQV